MQSDLSLHRAMIWLFSSLRQWSCKWAPSQPMLSLMVPQNSRNKDLKIHASPPRKPALAPQSLSTHPNSLPFSQFLLDWGFRRAGSGPL